MPSRKRNRERKSSPNNSQSNNATDDESSELTEQATPATTEVVDDDPMPDGFDEDYHAWCKRNPPKPVDIDRLMANALAKGKELPTRSSLCNVTPAPGGVHIRSNDTLHLCAKCDDGAKSNRSRPVCNHEKEGAGDKACKNCALTRNLCPHCGKPHK